MTSPSACAAPSLVPQIWQLDAAAHLLATLDERYAALRAAAYAPRGQHDLLMAQLNTADTELCLARASFLDAVCQLHVEKQLPPTRQARREVTFDALDVLWDFEAAWENALFKATQGDTPDWLVTRLEQGDELDETL